MQFWIAVLAAFILGLSKSGLKGMGMVIVTLMALVYGAKASTGILLPLLIFADILAVSYYNRHARWDILFRILPWMILGVVFAVILGKDLPEDLFKKGMAVIILVSVVIMFAWEKIDNQDIPNKMWFSGLLGLAAGFTTMIGNLAGAFSNIYFLSTRIKKTEFIGTAAWLFFIINFIKLPFHIFSWETIGIESLKTDVYFIPPVLIGFWIGIKIVDKINNEAYRKFILVMTALGAITMLI